MTRNRIGLKVGILPIPAQVDRMRLLRNIELKTSIEECLNAPTNDAFVIVKGRSRPSVPDRYYATLYKTLLILMIAAYGKSLMKGY